MPVNNFEVVKATVPITDVQDQATGKKVLSGVGLSDFISIGYKDLEGEEEDMIRVVHATMEGDVVITDLKEEEIADLLDRGCLIYYYDADNYFDVPNTKCLYFLCGTGAGDKQWRFVCINSSGTPLSWTFDTDADGYLFYYFD